MTPSLKVYCFRGARFSLVLMWVFCTCVPVSDRNEMQAQEQEPQRITLMEGLAHPWSMAFLSETEALVTEKDGGLKRVNLAEGIQTIISGLPSDRVRDIREEDPRDNAGLFDIVLDPKHQENGWVYVSYAAIGNGGTTTKVIRGKIRNDSLLDIQSLLVAEPYSTDRFHYGGGMVFGKDGKLYITIGERFYDEIDQPSIPVAQDPTDKRGMIYRINPDGSIPSDNPDFGEGAAKGAYAIGIRAAQGITLHPYTGAIWFSEHGALQGDEINVLRSGVNYGWPMITSGNHRNKEYTPPDLPGRKYTPPAWAWEGTVAPTGITFYTGNEFPQWKGSLFVAGLSRGSLWRMTVQGDSVVAGEELFQEERIRLRKVIQSPGGKVYLLTDEPNGRIQQIVPSTNIN